MGDETERLKKEKGRGERQHYLHGVVPVALYLLSFKSHINQNTDFILWVKKMVPVLSD